MWIPLRLRLLRYFWTKFHPISLYKSINKSMRERLALKLPAATIPGSLPFSLYPSSERFMQSLSDIIPAHSSGPFHGQKAAIFLPRNKGSTSESAKMLWGGNGMQRVRAFLKCVYSKRRPRKLLIHVNNLGLGPCSSSTRYFLVSELTQKRSGRNFALWR